MRPTLTALGALGLMLSANGARALAQSASPSAPAASAEPAKVFVEGGIAYGYELSNSQFIEVNNGTQLDSPGSTGPAVDLAAGYALVPHLFLMGDLQYAHASTIKGRNQDGDFEQSFVSYTSFSLGLRTTVPAGHGEVYAQMSLGMVLPFETERDQDLANGDSRVTTIGYNRGLGARGEMGYHYNINERMYLAGGLRLQAFATDNVGKERVRVEQPSGQVDRTTYTTSPRGGNNNDQAEALSVQDFRLRVGFGYRF